MGVLRGVEVGDGKKWERDVEGSGNSETFVFAKNETLSYNKMQQVTHIDNKVKRLQNIQARAGS